ncbi:MFS general substrate transporter [Lepidopterella palustris CBS 459.81]|uniref:MFS general substrate transporter n=1 Tax=Lepidopterella palustris CBS 459.81 TaxID=1314670 RepID=A0A8E2EDJ3_9PEZI|nr:MFS general substrate transporter [Lepidopterella palustris CBS 459.81]
MAEPLAGSTTTSNVDLASEFKGDDAKDSSPDLADLQVLDAEKGSLEPPQDNDNSDGSSNRSDYKPWQWVIVALALYSSAFLYGLDTTIVADIQAAAIETFGDVEKLGWLGIGFPLGSIATILSLSKAYGIFDVKWLFLGSLVTFEAGSALCGGAPSMNALIVGRVWAGAGGAGMYLGLLNLLSINTSIQKRALYMSGCGVVWGTGCILGPVIGGSFADSGATWRWAFYINLVLFGIFSPAYLFVLKSYNPQPNKTFSEKVKHIDWLGVVLNAAVYVTFVMVFTFGGASWRWSDGRTIAVFVVFGVVTIAFVVTQYFSLFTTPTDRLFPGDFLRSRSLILVYICQACEAAALFIPIYYIPIFFQFTRGDNGVDAAVRLLPFIIITIFCTMLNGATMPKVGYYMPYFLVSSFFLIIGGALMYATVNATTPTANIYGFSILMAIGAGLAQQAAYSVAPAKVSPSRVADAVGFINAAQIGSVVIALTITSTVFQNIGYKHVAAALHGLDFSSEDIHAALAGAKSAVFESAPPDVKEKVVKGIVKAIGDGYILVIVAGAVELVASVFLKKERLFMEAGAGA